MISMLKVFLIVNTYGDCAFSGIHSANILNFNAKLNYDILKIYHF